jgi:hypothetical protein
MLLFFHSPQESETSNIEDELTMIARGGQSFRVKVSIAERSSPYFLALLRNGMIETGEHLLLHCAGRPSSHSWHVLVRDTSG